ncbi:MAG: hypothetical protein FJ215_11935 [Ignavibacteria bacterium]|nr:hypothetical protein [Ignavibacteria bacterium]
MICFPRLIGFFARPERVRDGIRMTLAYGDLLTKEKSFSRRDRFAMSADVVCQANLPADVKLRARRGNLLGHNVIPGLPRLPAARLLQAWQAGNLPR